MINSRKLIAPLLAVVLVALFAPISRADDASSKSIASAKILLKNKDYDGAKQLLAPVVEKDENNAEAIYLLACSDEGLGNIKEAIDGYYKSLELLKADPSADAALKKQAQSAANRLDEGRKLVLAHAKQMEQEAAKFKEKNPPAYETVMAAVKLLSGDDVTIAASQGVQGKRHPKDAVEFQGHWYKFFDVPMPWHVAKKKCEDMGGYLVCIESKEEQSFVHKLRGTKIAWLGATDEEEGVWKWVTGSSMRYTNWSGHPDNANGGENAVEMAEPQVGGAWNDLGSDWRIGFICEWEK